MTYRTLRILAVCAALVAPALTSTRPAAAQGPAQVDPAQMTKQRDLFGQANKLWDEGKFTQAEALYKQAWAIKKTYDVAGNYGNLLADMNRPRAAAELLAFALREFPAGGRPAQRDQLLKRLGDMTKQVGTLRIEASKPDAEIFVDGQPVGKAPLPHEIYVDAGTHVIEARLAGFFPGQAQIEAQKGKSDKVSLELRAPKGPNKAMVLGGAAVGGAAVVAGAVVLALGATKSTTDLYAKARAAGGCPAFDQPQTGACADLQSGLNGKAAMTTAGVWTLVGGGLVGAATLVYGLTGGESAPKARSGLRVVPVVTGQSGGFLVSGSF